VLLDAPCSGLGVLAKRADLRWRRSLEDLQASAALAVRT
jgi:16S rRNA (cytosine967-C5)-methyltransferase